MRASIQQNVSNKLLESHAALVARLIRSQPALQTYFRWLARPSSKTSPPQKPTAPVKALLDQLINPLRLDADRATQRETESASLWLGSLCEYVADRSHGTGNKQLVRALAASLLPLYRTLATGCLGEGLAQTRYRLGETLAVLGLSEILQLQSLFESCVNPQTSPHTFLSERLKIDPSKLTYLIFQTVEGYNPNRDEFDATTVIRLTEFSPSNKLPCSQQIPDWANPQLLWVLSNELISSRNELVLPRSWIDTPVPWSRLSQHCHELECLLLNIRESIKAGESPAGHQWPTTPSIDVKPSSVNDHAERVQSDSPRLTCAIASPQMKDLAEVVRPACESVVMMDEIDRVLESECSQRSTAGAISTKAEATVELPGANSIISKPESPVVSKVVIGEITNHDDPAFANIVRRQVGLCKQEDRSICLAMILVTAVDQRENSTLAAPHDNGLSRWQQKLVNWICDHPELQQPAAFLTRDGQLFLLVLDTERNAMTRILRQGLVEVLSGQSGQNGDLSRVPIPAHFHVGIASTCSPSTSFGYGELIASAHRCQVAAQRMGSASIKSIEVY